MIAQQTEAIERTIPAEAWKHLVPATFRDGRLYPYLPDLQELFQDINPDEFYVESGDQEAIHWLSYFTLENYAEWAGAAIVGLRALSLEDTLFEFDDVEKFVDNGYRHPLRKSGEPDWYHALCVCNHTEEDLKAWARSVGIIPQTDLPECGTGYGHVNGLHTLPAVKKGLLHALKRFRKPQPQMMHMRLVRKTA
ncbi:hypothetical protein [Pseudarthrobacter phenanthrenivorans]|uniref:Uncharacterized protein n=1 Tax=Pseudarthrobacter phenanthrenivorans TaxID=361575 RepID=A0A0B4DIQ0_PSEPS|nr:hypothetical protein [Pseudarthrobacter phenanthrenivorans]KIC68707.1 hypothetical protein RM50_04400 [Pseudarthrobacter phenanthrenivorans]